MANDFKINDYVLFKGNVYVIENFVDNLAQLVDVETDDVVLVETDQLVRY